MNKNIILKKDIIPKIDEIIKLYIDSKLGERRPISDIERIKKMYENSNLICTAWDKDKLVGIARSVTDYSFCCYLSDLAVAEDYKKQGIGKALILLTKEIVGEESMLLLLSAPQVMEYYSKIGMRKVENGFIFDKRK